MLRSLIDLTTTTGMPIVLVLLKVTMVLLLAVGLTTLMQRSSATARHLVWLASLLALLVIPALAAWSPVRLALLPSGFASATPASATLPEAPSITSSPTAAVTAGGDARVATIAAPSMPVAAAATAELDAPAARWIDSLSPARVIIAVWAAVALALLAWLAHGADSVRRIVFEAEPLTDSAWQSLLMEIADRLQLDDMPRLVSSRAVTKPFASGFRVPTIVLPADCESWSPERRSAVLLHEVAHIRRRDILGHTLGRIVCALYWFHPMAWMAARRLRAESERACDDLALGCGTRASDYAEHLLEIVTSVRDHGTPSAAMAMATRSEFEGRMLAILDPTLARMAPTRAQASTLAGGVMMFAIVTGSVVPRAANSAPEQPAPDRQVAAAVSQDSVRGATQRTDTTTRVVAAPRDSVVLRAPAPAVERADIADVQISSSGATVTVGRAEAESVAGDSSARSSTLAKILVTDSSASLRRLAAWGLHDHTDDRAALAALVSAVRRDPSAAVREMAAWSLEEASSGRIAAAALADVIRDDKDRAVRETATWSLATDADEHSGDAIDALVSALRDDDADVREMAAWGLGNAEPSRAPAALVASLSDRSAKVRATAAWALFQIEDEATASALDAALQREMDPRARTAMVRALSKLGDAAVAPLQRIIEGSDSALRAIAIRSLAGQGSDPWPQPRPRPRPSPGF